MKYLRSYIKFNAIYALFGLQLFIFRPFLAPYLESLGFSDWYLALLFMAVPLSNILLLPHIGRIADKLPRTFLIWSGMLIQVLALSLYIIDHSGIIIFIARFLDGISAALVGTILISKIEDVIPNKKRATLTGATLTIGEVSAFIGPIIGGLLADAFFIRSPFFVSMIILSMLSFLLVENWKNPIAELKRKHISFSWKKEIQYMLSLQKLKATAFLGIVHHALYPALTIFIPLFITKTLNLSLVYIGYASTAYMIPRIFQFSLGQIFDRIGYRIGMIISTILSAISIACIPMTTHFNYLLLLLFILGTGSSMWNVASTSFLSNIGERKKNEGRLLTNYLAIAKMGSLASYIASAFLARFISVDMIFIMNSSLLFTGTLIAGHMLYQKTTTQ